MSKQLAWIDPNGNEYSLTSDNRWKKLQGSNGDLMPTFSYIEDLIPLQPGSVMRQVNVAPRNYDFPFSVFGTDETDLENNIRTFLGALNPLNGDGKIVSTATDGSQRELNCRYLSGLEGDQSNSVEGSFLQMILTFRAFDPYWYGTSTNVQTFTTGQPATFFPFFPLRLSSSQVFASVTVNNGGDVEAEPVWIITGPGSDIQLTNQTTGETLYLSTTLGLGESLTIDTRKGKKTITKNDGSNLYGSLTDDTKRSLWLLQPGSNSIELEMSGATQSSSVQLTYKNRYLGA